jgi:hypothetical protein
MDPETFNPINADLYRVVVMLIEGITLIVGVASLMFVFVAVVCAVCDLFGEIGQAARHQMKPAPETRANAQLGALSTLEYARHRRVAREPSSIH